MVEVAGIEPAVNRMGSPKRYQTTPSQELKPLLKAMAF